MRPRILVIALAGCACGLAFAQDAALQRCPTLWNPTERLACYDAVLPPVQPTPADRQQAFGLPQKSSLAEESSIESSVGPTFDGWGPNSRIRLDNGQVWIVTDGSSASLSPGARKVKVTRGRLGAYFLEFEGLNSSPKVRRQQ